MLVKRIALLAVFAVGSLAVCLALFGTGRLTLPSAARATAASSGPDLTALPLGDGRTTTTSPQPRLPLRVPGPLTGGGGASRDGPWIHGSTYDLTQKVSVDGSVSWPGSFTRRSRRSVIRLSGNGLPRAHHRESSRSSPPTTPTRSTATRTESRAHGLAEPLPAKPKYHREPACVGGEVGIMTARRGRSSTPSTARTATRSRTRSRTAATAIPSGAASTTTTGCRPASTPARPTALEADRLGPRRLPDLRAARQERPLPGQLTPRRVPRHHQQGQATWARSRSSTTTWRTTSSRTRSAASAARASSAADGPPAGGLASEW